MVPDPNDCLIGEWLNSYSVGNETLDSQHKKLLKMCRKLRDCLTDNSKQGDALFHEILNDLAVYAEIHFSTEEKMLRKVNYPELDAHMAEHLEYFEWLAALSVAATKGHIDKETLRSRVADWWINHICESDMAYKSYLSVDTA
jgi:hemerythrin